MSLINEALKKAQRQRSLDAAPLSSAPSGVAAAAVATHERAATHRRSGLAPLWFGLSILLLGASAAVLLMRYGFDASPAPSGEVAIAPAARSAAPVRVVASASAIPAVPSPPQPPALSPVAAVAPVAAPTPAASPAASQPLIQLPNFGGSESAAATSLASASPAPAPLSPPLIIPAAITAVTPTTAAPVAIEPIPAETDAPVYDFLRSARISGVRGLGNQARVLINEKIFRLDDVVSAELGLRLSAVRPGVMVFTDAQGKTFEKPY